MKKNLILLGGFALVAFLWLVPNSNAVTSCLCPENPCNCCIIPNPMPCPGNYTRGICIDADDPDHPCMGECGYWLSIHIGTYACGAGWTDHGCWITGNNCQDLNPSCSLNWSFLCTKDDCIPGTPNCPSDYPDDDDGDDDDDVVPDDDDVIPDDDDVIPDDDDVIPDDDDDTYDEDSCDYPQQTACTVETQSVNCRFPPHQCGTNGFCEPTPCKKQRHCLEAGNYGYCARQHTCGDGRKDTGETCDPTAEITGCVGDYYCNSDCTQCINPGTTPNTCRDGILQEPQEECEVNIDCAIQSETCIEETCQCEQSVCVPFPAEPCLQPNPSSECYSTCSENSDCFTNYECQFNTCVPTWECGNNVLDAGEQCENVNELDVGTCDFDGTRTGTIQTCSNTCACVSGSTCRNGVLNAGEECDLENNRVVFSVAYTEGDSCSSACKRIDQFSCGTDNLVSENEDCDIIEVTPGEYSHEGNCNFDLGEYCIPSASIFDGAGIQSRGCTCLPPPGDLCCDTIVRPVEKCDPSNSQHGYCSFDDPYFEECIGCQCGTQPVCDNGIPESGETCGEPGLSCAPGEDCINCQCIPSSTTCGDGIADPGEECNEPELPPCNATETCVNCQCVSPTQACGNGIPESGETCGEPELPSCPTGESCNSATCQCEPACGNGIADPNEECDFIFGLGEQGCTQEYYCLPPTIASGANKCTCTLRPLDPKIVIRQIEIQPLNHQPGKTLEQVSVTIQNVGKQSCTSGTIKISVTTADNASLDLSATSNSFSLDSLEANIINFLSAPSTPTLPNTSTLKSGAYSIITSVYCDSTLQDQKNAFFSIGGSTYAAIPETNLILVLLIGLVIVVLINQKQK